MRRVYVDSDSSSDDENDEIPANAYKALDIRDAIKNPHTYVDAIDELNAIVSVLYRRSCSKDARKLIDQDIEFAISHLTGDQMASNKALHNLITVSVEKYLPHNKKQTIHRLYRNKCVAIRRQQKRNTVVNDSNTSFIDLPKECIHIILSNLDPYCLIRMAITCTYLYEHIMCIPDSSFALWSPLLQLTFGVVIANASILEGEEYVVIDNRENNDKPSLIFTIFRKFALYSPEWLLPWKLSRIECHGFIRWISKETYSRLLQSTQNRHVSSEPRGIVMKKPLLAYNRHVGGIIFLTPCEVVVWLATRKKKSVLQGFHAVWKKKEADLSSFFNTIKNANFKSL